MARVSVAERRHNHDTLRVRVYRDREEIFTVDLEWLNSGLLMPPGVGSCGEAQAMADAQMAALGHRCSAACSAWDELDEDSLAIPLDTASI